MTVVDDRIKMADSDNERILDSMFEDLGRLRFLDEGYKVEIVEGAVHMSPQRDVHWQIIRRLVRALEDRFGMDVGVTSDVRIDFPGHLNGFCPDVAKLRDGAAPDSQGRWRHEDVEFIAEVISRDTAVNDYGPKKAAYAAAGVPVYLIVDPYVGKCRLYTQPKGRDYLQDRSIPFGQLVDLTDTPIGLTLTTDEFPRD